MAKGFFGNAPGYFTDKQDITVGDVGRKAISDFIWLNDTATNAAKREGLILAGIPADIHNAVSGLYGGDQLKYGTSDHLLRAGKERNLINKKDPSYGWQIAAGILSGGAGLRKTAAKNLINVGEDLGKGLDGASALKKLEDRKKQADILSKFGQKHTQEAARLKKVKKLSAIPKREVESTGKREAIAPDFYRKMAIEEGDAAVIEAASRGDHLKRTSTGYVGAPRTVTGPRALNAMRKDIDKDFSDAAEAVNWADPTRKGTWYDRAKAFQKQSNEDYQLPRSLEQHSVYSAGVSPESELAFALKHRNSRAVGTPGMAMRSDGMRTLDSAVAENRPALLGPKIEEYGIKLDPREPNTGQFGVNDFRRLQGMHYTDPLGNPWKAGASATQHPFVDAETALQVNRANQAGVGGRNNWFGSQIQELPWVYGKAQDIYEKGKNARFAGERADGVTKAIIEANNTQFDYAKKHAGSATAEGVAGASTGHVPKILSASPEEKLAYTKEGSMIQPSPEGGASVDALYSALGLRQMRPINAEGFYKNSLGQVETNPVEISRPLWDFPTGSKDGLINKNTHEVVKAVEQYRALLAAQEAGAANLPNTMNATRAKNSMVLDTTGRNPNSLKDPSAGVMPTADELSKIEGLVSKDGFGVTATGRGMLIFPLDENMAPRDASKALRKLSKEMERIYPSSQQMGRNTPTYVPGVGKMVNGEIVPTAPYSGEATGGLLSAYSKLDPTVAQNISESAIVRKVIGKQIDRDAKIGGARGDIQETRKFFKEADWPRAVEMIRKGMTPAAALSALGYSATSMAEENK